MADFTLPVQPTGLACNVVDTPAILDTAGWTGQVCQVNWPSAAGLDIGPCCADASDVRTQEDCTSYCRTDMALADWRSCVLSALGSPAQLDGFNPSCFDINEGILPAESSVSNLEQFPSITDVPVSLPSPIDVNVPSTATPRPDEPAQVSSGLTNLEQMPSFTEGPGGPLSSALESVFSSTGTPASTSATLTSAGASGASSSGPAGQTGAAAKQAVPAVMASWGAIGGVLGAMAVGAAYVFA